MIDTLTDIATMLLLILSILFVGCVIVVLLGFIIYVLTMFGIEGLDWLKERKKKRNAK